MILTQKDYRNILEVVEIVQSSADRASMFLSVCERLEKLVGFSSAVLLPIDSETKNFQWPGPVTYNVDMSAALTWNLYYAPLDPLIFKWDKRINSVLQNSDLVSSPSLADSEYGRDFLSPQGIFHVIGGFLGSQGDPVSGIGWHRQRGDRPFGNREKKITNMVMPHISRALHNIDLMDTIASSLEAGIIITGKEGRFLYMNNEAKKILNGKPPSVIPDPGFGIRPVFFRSETGTYRVRTIRNDKKWKENIFFLEPVPSELSLRSRLAPFGLTPRQQEVAALVIRGLSNREIAERLFISGQTVKDHIYDIFGKLQVRRRNELAAKIMGFSL